MTPARAIELRSAVVRKERAEAQLLDRATVDHAEECVRADIELRELISRTYVRQTR